jgi:hypothetical protein
MTATCFNAVQSSAGSGLGLKSCLRKLIQHLKRPDLLIDGKLIIQFNHSLVCLHADLRANYNISTSIKRKPKRNISEE